jgi:hypothetical protein
MMRGFLIGVLLTLFVGAAAVCTCSARGMAPVATSAQPMPIDKSLARRALHARMEKEMPRQVPIQADGTNLGSGARICVEDCAVCHGLPGEDQTAIAG